MTLRTTLLGTAATLTLASAGLAQEVTLSFMVDSGPDTVALAEALEAAYEAKHPEVDIELEVRPGGNEGDNIIKTRLATEELPDVFLYNSGSLFQALNPTNYLVDLTDEPFQAAVSGLFKAVVTAEDRVYGAPIGPAAGGGILYNRKVYADLGLEIPKTWDEFMANNAKIKEAGIVPVAQTYRTTWTSQLFVLADFYNVLAEVPDFAERYTANEAKYATTPAALRGFEHLEEVYKAGYLNEDFGAASYEDGLAMLAAGEAAHYPMLTFAIGAIEANHPDQLEDIGFFAQPGPDAAKNGLTTWMPAGLYIPQSSENIDAAKDFLAFVASPEGCAVELEAIGASGPFMIEGCELPDDAPQAVKDMLPYFEREDGTAPALEFLSPVKGPALEQITVEVGSGIRPAAEAAALYDEDVRKQAQQLGLPNW